jgi:hypothetical protein
MGKKRKAPRLFAFPPEVELKTLKGVVSSRRLFARLQRVLGAAFGYGAVIAY